MRRVDWKPIPLVIFWTGLCWADAQQAHMFPDSAEIPVFRSTAFPEDSSIFTLPSTVPRVVPLSPEQVEQKNLETKLVARAQQLAETYQLPVHVAGYSNQLPRDEEYKLYQGPVANQGAIVLNAQFWIDNKFYDSDTYLHYVLFRAAADYFYRRYFDADRCAWNVEGAAEPLRTAVGIFRESSDHSENNWMQENYAMSARDIKFRHSLDPEDNSTRILQKLTHYAFQAIEQRAADEWAVAHYHKIFKESETALISRRVNERERALAWDFNRATSAMTVGERVAFRQRLKSPYQYTNPGAPPAPPPPTTLGAGNDPGTSDPLMDDGTSPSTGQSTRETQP